MEGTWRRKISTFGVNVPVGPVRYSQLDDLVESVARHKADVEHL